MNQTDLDVTLQICESRMRRTLALALTTLFKLAMLRVNLDRFALLIFTLICVLHQMGC